MADSEEVKDNTTDDAVDEIQETEENDEVITEESINPVAPTPTLSPVVTVAAVETPAPRSQKGTTKNADESVTLSPEAFAGLMDRLAKLEDDAKLMNQVQDRNTIQKIEALRSQGKLVKSVKVRKIDGKFVVGWQTLQDDVYQDENGRLIEKQTVKIFFHEGSEKVYTMRQWASVGEYVPFEVTGETKDAEGNLFFKIVGPDGLALELNSTFIN